ncbi:hypothetical protein AB1Y20_001251 [Prymnesium parvum]|uniref:Adenylate kinase n=1 Tax=Prymnesium parvum TaxID=97485 RepID=A0AB34KAV7_PRYPA|mmetsp:Transcript_12739/g.31811  ORF Transcript_12739/g.31811 Transcript_12739/m.31811 type:complete len:587 (+) Transcript_12739:41-1801(+)
MEPEKAQTILAAAQRGKAARDAGACKLSKIWQALAMSDSKSLAEHCSSASAYDLCVTDPEGTTPLVAAIVEKKYDCARVLLGYEEALALPEAELKAWRLIQKSKAEAELEDTEEPVDVTDPEWQKEQSDAIFGPDADQYLFKSIVTIGIYRGTRAERDAGVEPTFDTEVTHRFGFGTALAPHGDIYVGSYGEGGLRSGEGASRLRSGCIYVGSWVDGKKHGEGMMSFPDGGVYKGAWAYGKRHGRGTFLYANGDAYTGEWHAGAKHGLGRYRQKELCCTYEGTWQHGVLMASKVISSDGSAFYGSFDKTGRPAGPGAYMLPNGSFVKGTYHAPPVEEEDADEPLPVLPSTWSTASMGVADTTQDALLKRGFCTVKPIVNAVIAGAPASGKGTQCEKIAHEFNLVHISTGDMLRQAAEDESDELGQQAKEHMEAGELVPDQLIIDMVAKRLNEPDCKEHGWLLDGFPRTEAQAKEMQKLFLVPSKAILLEVPDDVLVERVTGRRLDPETGKIYHMKFSPPDGEDAEEITARLTQRADDTEEALRTRLKSFAANKAALSAAFSDIIKVIDGNRAPDKVWEDVKKFLSA